MADRTKVQLLVMLLVWQTLATLPCAYCRPGRIYETPKSGVPPGCAASAEAEKLCQQCAKHTKSIIVYPLCCEDKEDARTFCTSYLDFGLH